VKLLAPSGLLPQVRHGLDLAQLVRMVAQSPQELLQCLVGRRPGGGYCRRLLDTMVMI
jgi:hypothetical protein